MKRYPLILVLILVVGLGGVVSLRSQIETSPDQMIAKLQKMKEANAAVIAGQKKALEDLKALEKDAAQIKVFAKRG